MDLYPETVLERARGIKLLCLDVDGVLTDGRLLYSSGGEELKAFHTQDGAAIKMLQQTGVSVAIITGRTSAIVARRTAELGIRHVFQGVEHKAAVLAEIIAAVTEETLSHAQIAHVGDDIADLALFEHVGLKVTVPAAHPEVLSRADYVTRTPAGFGAVREVCHLLMTAQSTWDTALDHALSGGRGAASK